MSKPRTVILGEKPQGSKWLRMVLESDLFDVIAGIPCFERKRWWGEDNFEEMLRANSVDVVKRKELESLDYDILFSFTYPFIIEGELLDKASVYSVNLHESPLPKYRGCNGYSHAILEDDSTYGTSLHTMVGELDAGELIDQEIFDIDPDETSKELYRRTIDFSSRLLERNLETLASGSVQTKPLDVSEDEINPRSSLEEVKKISQEQSRDNQVLYRYARALDFVPFEPACFVRDGKKFYVFIDGSEGREVIGEPESDDLWFIDDFKRRVVVMGEGMYGERYEIFG